MYRYQKQNAIAADKTKTPARWPGFVSVVPLQAGHAAMKTGVYPSGKNFLRSFAKLFQERINPSHALLDDLAG